jgi:hypothetical protein
MRIFPQVVPDFLWAGANEESNFGVNGNCLTIVTVNVKLLVVIQLGTDRRSEQLRVARTQKR